MPTFKFLPSIRDNETITCERCGHSQYPRNGACVVCRYPTKREYAFLPVDSILSSDSNISKEHLAQLTGTLLRRLRKRRGISQSQLATRTRGSMNRTSLSKAECGRMLLPLNKLLPLARALGLTAVILRFDDTATGAVHRSTKRR
jgi:ribosome-binding protein aMBF1 (putative translation factor)